MKKILILFLTVLLLSQVSYAFAELPKTGLLNTVARDRNATNSSAKEPIKPEAMKLGTARTESQANTIANLKERATTEITRRLKFLNELLTKLDKIKKISTTDKLALKTQIQTQIDGLTALQTKTNADTDLVTLKTDVKSIIGDYHIFAFFRVKIELLVASERMFTATDNLNSIYTKLKTRVADAKTQGKDVSVLESELSEMLLKINDAKIQYQAVETELSSLTAQGYPGNKVTLQDARAKIKLGAQDLRSAHQLIEKIRQELGEIDGNLNPKSSTHSAEEKLNR